MKRYRLVDCFGEPYATGYNETSLKELAYDIWSLGDGGSAWEDEEFYGKTREEQVNKIYSMLERGERDLIYIVEECDEPFETEGEYGDKYGFNYSEDDIIKYAKTRKDLGEYDKDKLVEFVHSFSTHNGLKSRPLSEILDEFSMIDYKEELFDYLNNILFDKFDEVVEIIQERFATIKGLDWSKEDCVDLASEFVDWKELYDLDYDD